MLILLGKLLIFLNLELSIPIIQVLVRYINNPWELNLVIDLMFSHANTEEFNKYTISSDLHSSFNYTSISLLKRNLFKIKDKQLLRIA